MANCSNTVWPMQSGAPTRYMAIKCAYGGRGGASPLLSLSREHARLLCEPELHSRNGAGVQTGPPSARRLTWSGFASGVPRCWSLMYTGASQLRLAQRAPGRVNPSRGAQTDLQDQGGADPPPWSPSHKKTTLTIPNLRFTKHVRRSLNNAFAHSARCGTTNVVYPC